MRYFIALFCSPLACLLAPDLLATFLNCFLYFGSFIGWLFFFVPGIVLWFLGVMHAWFVVNAAKEERRAERIIRTYERDRLEDRYFQRRDPRL